jgi:type II restriction enzyme
MRLKFDTMLAENYSSNSQKVRVLSEQWVSRQVFCPNCGQSSVDKYANNKPVADFFCPNCREDYELKSKKLAVGTKIVDGAYRTMLERLQSSTNLNFFLLSYSLQSLEVSNFLVVPKHFFVPEIIEKRRPLAPTARRAGWVGCNIDLRSIPESGKIFFVRAGQLLPKATVLAAWQKTLFLRAEKDLSAKRWTVDVMNCIERLGKQNFSLADVYAFEDELEQKHPNNRHIKDKIRQQLQVLRDKDYLEFTSRGQYRLT